MILDGKVVATDRCAETKISKKGEVIGAWYAGKTHDFGGNVQAGDAPGRATDLGVRGRARLRA